MAERSSDAIKIYVKTSLKTLGDIEVWVTDGSTIDIVDLTTKAREAEKIAADKKKTEKAEAKDQKAAAKATAKPKAKAKAKAGQDAVLPREVIKDAVKQLEDKVREHNKESKDAKLKCVDRQYEENPEYVTAELDLVQRMDDIFTTLSEESHDKIDMKTLNRLGVQKRENESIARRAKEKAAEKGFKGMRVKGEHVECFECGRMWPLKQGYKCEDCLRTWSKHGIVLEDGTLIDSWTGEVRQQVKVVTEEWELQADELNMNMRKAESSTVSISFPSNWQMKYNLVFVWPKMTRKSPKMRRRLRWPRAAPRALLWTATATSLRNTSSPKKTW